MHTHIQTDKIAFADILQRYGISFFWLTLITFRSCISCSFSSSLVQIISKTTSPLLFLTITQAAAYAGHLGS